VPNRQRVKDVLCNVQTDGYSGSHGLLSSFLFRN
jgi:hypothetical protein